GQVHRATLPDGAEWVVKVAYPGLSRTVARDLGAATLSSRIASFLYPRAHLDSFVREVKARILEEFDYSLEARRQQRFAEVFAGHPTLLVPAVQTTYSSAGVLTTSFVRGVHLPAYLASSPSEEARTRAGLALFDFYLGALFRYGLYNCD